MRLFSRKATQLAVGNLDLQLIQDFDKILGRDALLFCYPDSLFAGYLVVLLMGPDLFNDCLFVHAFSPCPIE